MYFLAPNYRTELFNDLHVRLAIAHAIDRNDMLNKIFRPGNRKNDHAALSGPFPKHSWAYNSKMDGFYKAVEAPIHLSKAKQSNETSARLARPITLVYPGGDLDVKAACSRIAGELIKQLGLNIKSDEEPPETFHDRIINKRNFDLAYWRHEFTDETYWLKPLLDSSEESRKPGGSNFLGYIPDANLGGLFKQLHRHKFFPTVRTTVHHIHEHITRNAVVIPLWQLDTYIAVHDAVKANNAPVKNVLDPAQPYADVAEWYLEK